MGNEIIELPVENRQTSLALTRESVEAMKQNRQLLMEFVKSQLREGVDFGVIPGTDKPTLYKPGAEKMRALFSLQTKTNLVDKELDRGGNFAMFTYQTEVRDKWGNLLATCDGSCNSQEKKYRERSIYDWVDMHRQDGSTYRKKQKVGSEATPVCDVLNTLQKMAQKRAYVGAIILATGASDFFNQDIDDPEDAATLGVEPKQELARAQVSVPRATSAASQNQADQRPAAQSNGGHVCELCGAQMRLSRNGDAYTCPNWKDQSRGRHSYVQV